MQRDARFFLSIQADRETKRLLPKEWESFLVKSARFQEEIVIHLAEDNTLEKKKYSPGWSVRLLQSGKQAVYAPRERPYFSIVYGLRANEVNVFVRKALDSFVKLGVMYGMLLALHRFCIGLHGVTLKCGGQTLILSAPSGTGKTTLAQLLETNCAARVINGDFALLSLDKDGVVFEPTPFCGTSRICLNERVKVDRIVFLSQSRDNLWHELDGRQSVMKLMSNSFVPSFDSVLQQDIWRNVIQVLSFVKTSEYAFAPTKEAAHTFFERITGEDFTSK